MNPSSIVAIIPANGKNTRFGGEKHEIPLGNKRVVDWCLDVFRELGIATILVGHMEDADAPPGDSRDATIRNGIEHMLKVYPDTEAFFVHDGARPFLSIDLVSRVLCQMDEVWDDQNIWIVAPTLPLTETVQRFDKARGRHMTLLRDRSFKVQCPVLCKMEVLWCYDHEWPASHSMLDWLNIGKRAVYVDGCPNNIKITYSLDYELAKLHAERMQG